LRGFAKTQRDVQFTVPKPRAKGEQHPEEGWEVQEGRGTTGKGGKGGKGRKGGKGKGCEDETHKYEKTQICKSVLSQERCPHWRCRYAHEMDELSTVRECGYGYNCKKMKWNERHGYFNSQRCEQPCNFIHPEETKENYWARMTRK
jgi:hypothetical protein